MRKVEGRRMPAAAAVLMLKDPADILKDGVVVVGGDEIVAGIRMSVARGSDFCSEDVCRDDSGRMGWSEVCWLELELKRI